MQRVLLLDTKRPFFLAATGLTLLWALSFLVTPYMVIATLAYLLLVAGLRFRRSDRRLHAYFMSAGISVDLALVFILEVQRGAIDTAMSFTLSPLQQAHIAFSTGATLLYLPVLVLGYLRLSRKSTKPSSRRWHIRLGLAAFICRTLGLILMFSLLK